MIWLRASWALCLAGLLGFTFRQAWKWEHRAAQEGPEPEKGRETFVFLPPTALFWLLLTILGVMLLRYGPEAGLRSFLGLAAEILITFSLYDLLLLALLPLLRRRFSARACALLWVIPVFLFYMGFNLLRVMPMPGVTLYLPREAMPRLLGLWFTGFLCVEGWYLVSHLAFRIRVRRVTAPVTDEAVLELWERERERIGYRKRVKLLRGGGYTPFSMGRSRWSRCTVLPDREYSSEELSLVFRHELHHLQRCDVDTKVYLSLCTALCWFDPLVWIAARKAAGDLERSCDEIVTEGMEGEKRRAYARLLLDSAAPSGGCTTCLSAAAGTLRYRLRSVLAPRHRRTGTLLLMAVLFLCAFCFGALGITDARCSLGEVLPEGAALRSVYRMEDGRLIPLRDWDEPALRRALEDVALEHLMLPRQSAHADGEVELVFDGLTFITLGSRGVAVYDSSLRDWRESYILRGAEDWDALCAALGLPAGTLG